MNAARVVLGMVAWSLMTAAATPVLQAGVRSLPVQPHMEVFVREGCPHCARAKAFLADLTRARPELRIVIKDVAADSQAFRRLVALGREHGIDALGVPAFYVGDRLLVGFMDAETTGRTITELLDAAGAPAASPGVASARDAGAPDAVDLPVFGRLRASRVGLPLFTVAIGLVDGFNPCAMWALLFLLSLLVGLRDRRKMFAVAGTFVLVGGLVYFAFIAAWFELFLLIGLSRIVQLVLGGVAVAAGGINVKDFVAFRRGVSLGIPDAAKPTIYHRVRRVLSAEHLAGAIVAVAVLAALVNLVELLCTAGLPALYTQVLAAQELTRPAYYGYLVLYIAAYLFDDSLVLAVAVITLSERRLQARAGRWLKLLGGSVMMALGLLLIFRPRWLL